MARRIRDKGVDERSWAEEPCRAEGLSATSERGVREMRVADFRNGPQCDWCHSASRRARPQFPAVNG